MREAIRSGVPEREQAEHPLRRGRVDASRGLWILANTDHLYNDREGRQTIHLLQNGEEIVISRELQSEMGYWFQVSYEQNGNAIIGYVPQIYIQELRR